MAIAAIGLLFGGSGLSATADDRNQAVAGAGSPPGIAELQALFDARRFQDVVVQGPEALARAEREHGADSLEAAEVIDLLVQALSKAGKSGEPSTTALAERGVATRERHLGPDDPRIAAGLNTQGLILIDTARHDAAKQVLARALSIREKAFGPNDPQVADTLVLLGVAHARTDDRDAARQLWERALSIRQAAYGPDDVRVAQVLLNLGIQAMVSADLPRAIALTEEARRIQEKGYGPESPELGNTLAMLGTMYQDAGDTGEALQLLEQGLTIQRAALHPGHPRIAGNLVNLGISRMEATDVIGAIAAWAEAAAIFEKALGPTHPFVAEAYNNLGIAHRSLGDFDAARADLERALAITEKASGPGHTTVARAQIGLGQVLNELGRSQEAVALVQHALETREKALGNDHPLVAENMNILAEILMDRGDVAAALPLTERALAILEKNPGPDSLSVAHGLGTHLGRALVLSGRYADARVAYERALAIFGSTVGPEHSANESPLAGLAFVDGKLGRQAEALDAAVRARQLSSSHIRLAVSSMTENEALRYAARQVATSDLTLSLLSADPAPSELSRAWDALQRARALVLEELIERRQSLATSPDPETATAYRDLARVRKRLAKLLLESPDELDGTYKSDLLAAREADAAAERALADRSARFRARRDATEVSLDQVRSALPEGAALVAYYRYEAIPLKAPTKTGDASALLRPTPSYAALILRSGSASPHLVRLGPASVIDAAVSDWANEIARAARNPARASEEQYRGVARALKAAAWDPVAAQLGAARMVFVVPDGALHRVNLSTLPSGESRYLLEDRRRLHYLSAERELARPTRPAALAAGMLAMGNPAFEARPTALPLPPALEASVGGDQVSRTQPSRAESVFRGAHSRCARFSGLTFEALPSAAAEVREVTSAWEKATGSAEPIVLTGPEATEAAFKALAPGRKVVHLASHGFFLDADCSSASDLPDGQSRPWSSTKPATPSAENPLLLSGIALAGANERASAPPDGEDGVLTAEEAGALDLSGTEWVVLSGCDTGIGALRSGEGVLGLSRAFRVAGARTLVLSLWPVDDESARQWMRALYDLHFARGRSTVDAVRGASLEVLGRRRAAGKSSHPLFWGGFVASGDWR